MPKTLWLPGGRGGGGKPAILSPSVELKQVCGQWMIVPTPKFISDCKEQGRSEVTRQVSGMTPDAQMRKLEDMMVRAAQLSAPPPMIIEGYSISRPAQNPCPKALAEPVQRVRWWEGWDERVTHILVVVALILIVLVAIVVQGVAW